MEKPKKDVEEELDDLLTEARERARALLAKHPPKSMPASVALAITQMLAQRVLPTEAVSYLISVEEREPDLESANARRDLEFYAAELLRHRDR